MSEKLAINGGKRTVPEGIMHPWPQVTDPERDAVMEVLSTATMKEQRKIKPGSGRGALGC